MKPTIASINGRDVRFEVLGDPGSPTMVMTGGGFWPLDNTRPGCEAMSRLGWRVVNWDRPGSGGSDFDFDAPDLLRSWADALAGLLTHLSVEKAVVGGGSGGCATSLAFAHHHLERVLALVCVTPHTDDAEIMQRVREQTFATPAQAVQEGGMAALLEHSTGFFNFDDQLNRFPEKRDRVLSTDPPTFIAAMQRWSQMWADPRRAFLINLTDAQLREINVPTLVLPPLLPNDRHPLHTAEALAHRLRQAKLQDWRAHFGGGLDHARRELEKAGGGTHTLAAMAPAIDTYLRRLPVASGA